MDIWDRVEKIETELDALINRAELWQALFDECPISIACFNSQMRFFLVNHEFCDLVSYSREELIGESINLVLPDKFKRMHKVEEAKFMANPEKKTNRHGLSPFINDKYENKIKIDIDLSYFYHDDSTYYVAFVRRI